MSIIEQRNDRPIQWIDPPHHLSLPRRDVHLWHVPLDNYKIDTTALKQTLTLDETQHADRFRFTRHRDRFIVGRAALRAILGSYVGADPMRLPFDYNDHGKPRLMGQRGPSAIRFNLTHAGSTAVVAVARGRTVGVDVERIIDRGSAQRIADRFFTPREAAAIRSLHGPDRTEAFFNCWTRKEAYVKAIGTGISMPLNHFEVSVLPGEPAMLLNVSSKHEHQSHWSMINLRVAPGYIGALVVEGDNFSALYWQWRF